MYKEDFDNERKDREAMNDQLQELKEKSSAIINRLETANQALVKKCNPQTLEQLHEDYQISQSQIIAYKKQLDACKKELEEERRRGQVMQERIYTLNAIQEQATMLQVEVHVCLCTCHLIVGCNGFMRVCLRMKS